MNARGKAFHLHLGHTGDGAGFYFFTARRQIAFTIASTGSYLGLLHQAIPSAALGATPQPFGGGIATALANKFILSLGHYHSAPLREPTGSPWGVEPPSPASGLTGSTLIFAFTGISSRNCEPSKAV